MMPLRRRALAASALRRASFACAGGWVSRKPRVAPLAKRFPALPPEALEHAPLCQLSAWVRRAGAGQGHAERVQRSGGFGWP
jgi:hypothetical protein